MRLGFLDRCTELSSSLTFETRRLVKSCGLGALIFVTGFDVLAQNAASLPTSQLQMTARDLVANGDFIQAREYLVELERRLIELPPEQQGEALQSVYVFLSVACLQTYGSTQEQKWLQDAIAACDKYITKYPDGTQLGIVLVNKADALRALGKFAEAAPVLEQALRPPAVDGLKSSVQLDVLDKIVQAYYVTENWSKGIPWFTRMMEYTDFPEKVSQAATALVEAFIATDRVEEMMAFVPVLARDSGARYNIRLNAKLIAGADKLAEKEKFAQASFLYNLVLSKDELIAFHQGVYDRNIAQIEWIEKNELSTANLSKLRIDAENAQNQVKALQELADYTAELEWRKAQMFQKTGRDYEAFWAFYRLLRDFPDRKDQLENFHYAAFVQANEIKFGDRVVELGGEYILQDVYNTYLKEVTFMLAEVYKTEGPFERFRTLATQFVVKYPNDDFAGAMIYLLADAYSARGDYQALADDFGEMIASMTSGRVMDGLYYWRGMAGIFIEDYDLSVRSFSQLFDQYSSSPYREDAEFRMGVVQFAMGDMDAALKTMNNFVKRYPQSVLLGEAHVYLGDLYASIAEVDLALDNYEKVPEHTDAFEFIDHAFFQSARLCEENEFYGQMLTILKDYVDRFPNSPNLSRAVYELGRAFELEDRPVDTLFTYLDAIRKFGDARLSFGVDEIVEAFPAKYYEHYNRLSASIEFLDKLFLDQTFRDEIVTNRRALFEFLSENPDIDREVRDLVMRNKDFRESLSAGVGPAYDFSKQLQDEFDRFPKEKPEEFFQTILTDARLEERATLELRMMMALDKKGHTMADAKSFTSEQLDDASPAIMVWMAQRIRESGDLALELIAKEALETVIANYRDDEASHFEALVEYGKLELSYANFDSAQAYLQEAVDRYPFDPDVTDATVLLADALRASGAHEEAIDKYERILRDKQLYGKPVRAEVQYKIGLSFFERGMFQDAHAYFERVFLAFSGFKDWAARAYLKDAESLISLGSPEDAARTLREAMKTQNLRETEVYADIEKLYQSLVTN